MKNATYWLLDAGSWIPENPRYPERPVEIGPNQTESSHFDQRKKINQRCVEAVSGSRGERVYSRTAIGSFADGLGCVFDLASGLGVQALACKTPDSLKAELQTRKKIVRGECAWPSRMRRQKNRLVPRSAG